MTKMNTKYFEIEKKYKAGVITKGLFRERILISMFLLLDKVIEPIEVEGPDEYWSNDKSVIRFRYNSENFKELTTKKRTSQKNTTVRHETDLKLREDMNPEDVASFLKTAGYKKEFTLFKRATIIPIDVPNESVTLVYYEVWDTNKKNKIHKYIEVEGSKGQKNSINKKLLTKWEKILVANFKNYGFTKKSLVNKSLYEIFKEKSKTCQ